MALQDRYRAWRGAPPRGVQAPATPSVCFPVLPVRHRGHDVVLRDGVDDVLAREDAAEHRVAPVEMRRGAMGDEELAAVGAGGRRWPSRGFRPRRVAGSAVRLLRRAQVPPGHWGARLLDGYRVTRRPPRSYVVPTSRQACGVRGESEPRSTGPRASTASGYRRPAPLRGANRKLPPVV